MTSPTPDKIDQLAAALTTSGHAVSADNIRAAIEAGAQVNEDGRMNVLNLVAWLMKGK